MELIQIRYHSLQLLEEPSLCLETSPEEGLQTELYIQFSFTIQNSF